MSVAALSLLLISLVMFAIPVNAQETTGEETTGMAKKEGAVAKAGDAVARTGDQNTGAVAKTDGAVAKAQSSQSQAVAQQDDSDERDTAKAAENDSQNSNRAEARLVGMMVQVSNTNGGNNANVIGPITVSNCDELEVDSDAVIVLRGDGGARVRISNRDNNFIVAEDGDQLRITGPSGGDLVGTNVGELGASRREIIDSTGITCGRGNAGGDDNGGDGGDGDDDNGNTGNANNLEDLECTELLRRFRNEDDGQYDDTARFADVDVRDRIIVCLEQEVDSGTAADEKLPDTGGLSLLGLAVLGIVSAVAGVSVVRGTRREE